MLTVVVSVKVCVVENTDVETSVVLNVLVRLAGAGLNVLIDNDVVVVVTVVLGVLAVTVLDTVFVCKMILVVEMITVHLTLWGYPGSGLNAS
jgi:hypothetical protein